jgi:hypothetical protein
MQKLVGHTIVLIVRTFVNIEVVVLDNIGFAPI